MQRFLESFECRPPASKMAIEEFESGWGAKLPVEYVEFLGLADGGEGFVGEKQPLILWRVEELNSINEGYHVREYAPGLLVFGSNGGGDAYGFDTRSPHWRIVEMPFWGWNGPRLHPWQPHSVLF